MQPKSIILALFAATSVSALNIYKPRQSQNGTASASASGADFGQCDPSIDFQLGREGRKADEGTFLPVDPLVAQGQQVSARCYVHIILTPLRPPGTCGPTFCHTALSSSNTVDCFSLYRF